ncbi:MAG: Mitochondrial distribution and morphology protein 31, mitochondrial precursor [Thelocarpon impressellum]|nr:MAG: Mitochondrial distribution and morphology protein 31, mitochondrial precursor [Thelocarpon impressellum]
MLKEVLCPPSIWDGQQDLLECGSGRGGRAVITPSYGHLHTDTIFHLASFEYLTFLAQGAWRRGLRTTPNRRIDGGKRDKSSSTVDAKVRKDEGRPNDPKTTASKGEGRLSGSAAAAQAHANRHILDRLPHLPHLHRPSKEELLAAATGFWSRLTVRFKWFSIRSARPFNTDDISAFLSWFLLGHVIWILVGTTTFVSLAILTVNTVFAQETLARWVGNYLTRSSGINVVFESAIVPRWGDGVITLKNVFVSRRPGQGKSKVSKGSPMTAAAAAAAARTEESSDAQAPLGEEEEDTNYTQFDLTLDTVNVSLSFAKWFNGKGLLRDVEVKGMRGVIDRTSVHYTDHDVDPRSYKHEHHPGDFEIDSFKMEDLLVTVHQPDGFRPFSVSIFSCDLPQLRKRWLFYDFLSANTMSGSFDDSLFTIHPRQTHSSTGAHLNNGEVDGEVNPWKKHSRLRIDGLSIDHLNRGAGGPFSWIHEGNVDIVADIMFPKESDESIAKVVSDMYDRVEATVTSHRHLDFDSGSGNGKEGSALEPARAVPEAGSEDDKRFVVMDLRVHLNDVRAAVPLFTRDLSYVNNALVRPIVAYINSRKTFIPITCRLVKRAGDFDGSWTIFDSGLMNDLSVEVYEAFARDVVDDQARMRRFKKVGLWSLHLAIQALFMGMAGNIA